MKPAVVLSGSYEGLVYVLILRIRNMCAWAFLLRDSMHWWVNYE